MVWGGKAVLDLKHAWNPEILRQYLIVSIPVNYNKWPESTLRRKKIATQYDTSPLSL